MNTCKLCNKPISNKTKINGGYAGRSISVPVPDDREACTDCVPFGISDMKDHCRNCIGPDSIFVRTTKTASRSIMYELFGRSCEHCTAAYFKSAMPDFDQYFSFGFVRNPWDLVVSQYHYILQQGWRKTLPPVAEYVKMGLFKQQLCGDWLLGGKNDDPELNPACRWPHEPRQLPWFTDENNTILVDFVGKFENLEDDFAYICKELGKPAIKLRKTNATKHDDYRSYYDSESVDIVANYFRYDIERFEYSF